MLAVRLGRVDSVENPNDDNGVGAAGLGQVSGIGNPDDKNGVGLMKVCHRFIAQPVLSVSCAAAFCCLFSQSAERACTCFSPVVSLLLVTSSAV